MNNTRGPSVDFLSLPQLIKDATHWVRQREESRQATGKVGKWERDQMVGLQVEHGGKKACQRERRRQVERDGLFLAFLGELSSINDGMPGECQCTNEKSGIGKNSN